MFVGGKTQTWFLAEKEDYVWRAGHFEKQQAEGDEEAQREIGQGHPKREQDESCPESGGYYFRGFVKNVQQHDDAWKRAIAIQEGDLREVDDRLDQILLHRDETEDAWGYCSL